MKDVLLLTHLGRDVVEEGVPDGPRHDHGLALGLALAARRRPRAGRGDYGSTRPGRPGDLGGQHVVTVETLAVPSQDAMRSTKG